HFGPVSADSRHAETSGTRRLQRELPAAELSSELVGQHAELDDLSAVGAAIRAGEALELLERDGVARGVGFRFGLGLRRLHETSEIDVGDSFGDLAWIGGATVVAEACHGEMLLRKAQDLGAVTRPRT